MIIAIPREIKDGENRVALTPAGKESRARVVQINASAAALTPGASTPGVSTPGEPAAESAAAGCRAVLEFIEQWEGFKR